MFSATQEDIRPLFSTSKKEFEAQLINTLGTEYVYLEDKATEEVQEESEESEEEYEQEYEEEVREEPKKDNFSLPSYSYVESYVEAKTSPFGN
jgi:hypothetical protein